MLEELLDFLKDKKILVLGFGIEGKASYNFLRRNFPNKKIYISDKKDFRVENNEINKKLIKEVEKNLVEITTGDKYLENLKKYDLILKTPGLSFKGIKISKIEDRIYTSIDLFLKYYNNVTIGITGTKGKSTISTMIYNILKNENKDVYLLGNIGIPIFDQIENINKDSIVVIELSSHQLQFMKYTTQIAILINVFPEHLDHYNSYKEYVDCKYKIFSNSQNMLKEFPKFKQTQIYGKETESMKQKKYKYNKESLCINIEDGIYDDIIKKLDLKVVGRHNIQNAIFALVVADILNVNMEKAIETIKNFKGLPHRLEYVTTFNNVKYYDDSISTIPETTIAALKTLKETETLIIGGLNRNINYKVLIKFLNKIYELNEYSLKNIILLPTTGHDVEQEIREEYNKVIVNDIKEAVKEAVKVTKEGNCLLSPAAASYGFYKNFEERGNVFKETINQIAKIK